MEDGHCVATVHAEANAIIQAAKNGVAHRGARSIYTTATPLLALLQAHRELGPVRIVFGEFYRDERIFEVARELGIELVDLAATAK